MALLARYAAYSVRERALLAVAAIALVIYVGDTLWLAPIYGQAKTLSRQTAQQEKEFAALQQQLFALQAEAAVDKNLATRDALAGVEVELAQLDQQLAGFEQTLVSPSRMSAVLAKLLRARPGVRLISLQTLPLEALDASGQPIKTADEAAAVPFMYRHGFELTLSGPYLELTAWLAELEAGTQQLLWQSARLAAGPAQQAQLVLVFYTLSLDASWIAL
ncbi:MAG: hypothetical protein PHT48_05745 [Dechloromonas sp.]|nr:hypothetical protein [Dechloromonas sp.]